MSVLVEQQAAKLDAQLIANEYGQPVTFKLRSEADVQRDVYNSIKARPTAAVFSGMIYCYPINYSPTERQLVKAGLKESVDLIVYVPVKSLDDNNATYDSIDMTRSTVIVDGRSCRIKEKARSSQFGDQWLYYTLGLVVAT